jgi:hypothetical protein
MCLPSFLTLGAARLVSAGPKKAGGKLGLGVKKLGEKVDDSLFEQPPAPVSDPLVTAGTAATPAGAGNVRSPAEAAKPAGSRFAYDTLTQVPVR